ncbi:MAG: Negative regulator of genetic competence ClpC/MecB [candidate division WS6 bacterium OLB20]|uniref:Negative regulator of genetic competence ClpC/MecB n=1 Tax=candidate division WS6 bacterium OLB20 TaxID=1617426 RepID=A0A136LYH7_9BACT|nr:MAG: Negative regulator of genetic competence ClpC/MecB [candidate division WS6 bacterium OLB20]
MDQNQENNNIKGLGRISRNLSEVLIKSFELAHQRGGKMLNAKDIFLGILDHRQNIAARLLEKLGVDLDATKAGMMDGYHEAGDPAEVAFGEDAKQLLTNSFLLASELNHVYVGTEHMLLAILRQDDLDFVRDLAEMGFSFDFVRQSILNFGIYQPGIFSKVAEQQEEEEQQSSLSYFARDMNEMAEQGKFLKVWGREEEIERLIHILSRRTKNNPILVGEAGVGKTAIVEGFVQRIISGDVPKSFKNKKVVQLDLSAIIAGSKIRGDVEERLLGIVSEMAEDKDLIMFIDEIHMIVGAGAAGSGNSMDIANILKPYLTNGDLRVIGATTWDEYQKYFEEDDALARRFQPVRVDEISADDAIRVLEMLRPEFEEFHSVRITDFAIEEAVLLADRYITNKYLPDKAIDVIDEAASAKKIALEKKGGSVVDVRKRMKELTDEKDKAIDSGDFDKAAELRKEEKQLAGKLKKLAARAAQTVKSMLSTSKISVKLFHRGVRSRLQP